MVCSKQEKFQKGNKYLERKRDGNGKSKVYDCIRPLKKTGADGKCTSTVRK
jgi:hypothetical protein